MKRALLVVTAISTLLAVSWIIGGRAYSLGRGGHPGPGLFPLLIACWLLAASIVVAWQTARSGELAGVTVAWPNGAGMRRMAGILAACLLFIGLLEVVGDFAAGALTILLVLRVMGMTRWVYLIPTALVMAAVTHWLFAWFLGVPLPRGTMFG